MGHSKNSYTRYAFSVLSSNDGTPGLPTNRTYDVYGDFSQAFEVPHAGVQRLGAYMYRGQSPTYYQTSGGVAIPGTGLGDRPFYRAGAYGIWYAGKFDFSTLFMHGEDNVLLGTGTPANQIGTLPAGAQSPVWNGGFIEGHYTYSPQLILVGRYETIHMAKQALPIGSPLPNGVPVTSNFGNTNAYVGGFRWYPIMSSRAGLAVHVEYANVRVTGAAPVSGRDVRSSSVMLGFDFAY